MSTNNRNSKLLASILVLQVLTLGSQWTGQAGVSPAVAASIPDPGARQMQMVDELKELNTKFDRFLAVVESGKLQVNVVNPEESK